MAYRISLKQSIPIVLLSTFWSLFVLCRLLWTVVVNGPKKAFHEKKREIRPDTLDDQNLGTHGFARLKRLKLHYVAKGSESKPLMLMLHGFPEFWYSWRHQLKEFGGDYRAVAMDMRGYGESDKPGSIQDYTMDKLVADIQELIQALGYEKCVLVAHDWGGAVAWAFSQIHPHMVDKLIICNCPHGQAFRKMLVNDRKQFFMSWYMMFFQMPFLPELSLRINDYTNLEAMYTSKKLRTKPGALSSEDIEMFKYTFSNGGLTGPINYYRAEFQFKSVLVYPKEKLKVPTLMIWGTKDGFLGSKLAELSGDYVEDYHLQYVEGASHWVQQEEPEQVNKYIRQFLSQ